MNIWLIYKIVTIHERGLYEREMEQQYIKGIPFCSLEYKQIVNLLKDWLPEKTDKPRFVVTANPEIVMFAQQTSVESVHFKNILLSADLITADGIGVILGSENFKWTVERTSYRCRSNS